MDIVGPPHQTINKNFLVAVGLWPHQTGIFKYVLLFNMLFLTMSQGYLQTAFAPLEIARGSVVLHPRNCCGIGGMIAAWEDTDVFMESIPPVLVDFVCGAKVINFIGNSRKMKRLLLILEEDWNKFKVRHDESEIMDRYGMMGQRLTLSYAACLYGSMSPFMILPAVPIFMDVFGSSNVTHAKQLMFRVDFLMDAQKYYYPLLIHSYFGTMAYITTVVAIDTIFMIFVQHACSSLAILGYQLEHLTDYANGLDIDVYPQKNDDISYRNMARCVVQHNHALEYCNLIESANFVSFFFQLGFNMICISFTGFQTVQQMDRPDVAFRYAAFTMTQLFLLFLQSYPAQMLLDHSSQVSEYVHNCGWYQTSLRTRKLVNLMILRSRMPCELTAGKFYVLNLANFSAVVRTSMSYLTMLTSVR